VLTYFMGSFFAHQICATIHPIATIDTISTGDCSRASDKVVDYY